MRETEALSEESGAAYREGKALFGTGNYADAAERFGEAYGLDERNTAALFARGLSFYRLKEYGEAAAVMNLVLGNDPAHEKALRLLPAALASTGRLREALTAYDRGIGRFPDSYWFYYGKAKAHIGLGENKEAVPLLEQAIRMAPGRLDIIETLASVYAALGKMDKAFEQAQVILGTNPRHPQARVIAADYKRLTGRLDEALEDYGVAAGNIETKAYAEHYMADIRRTLEERAIEKEYEEHLKEQ